MATATYTRQQGLGLTYRIEADTRGTWHVYLGDKLLATGHDASVAHGVARPSKAREQAAIEAARFAIEGLRGMLEE